MNKSKADTITNLSKHWTDSARSYSKARARAPKREVKTFRRKGF